MSAQSFIRVDNKMAKIYLKNCRVSNVYSDWSNARGIDNRGVLIDTLWEVNCSWYRIGQRAYRDGGGILNYGFFNHNTFVDIGTAALALGLTKHLVYRNNLVVNCAFLGDSPASTNHLVNLLVTDSSQTAFAAHNVFYVDTAALNAAFHAVGFDTLKIVSMFSDTLNGFIAKAGLTSTNIFSQVTFTKAPGSTPGAAPIDSIARWYWRDPTNHTNDASILKVDSIQLVNLAYSTSTPAYTFGDDGLPVGSTEWFNIPLSAVKEPAKLGRPATRSTRTIPIRSTRPPVCPTPSRRRRRSGWRSSTCSASRSGS